MYFPMRVVLKISPINSRILRVNYFMLLTDRHKPSTVKILKFWKPKNLL